MKIRFLARLFIITTTIMTIFTFATSCQQESEPTSQTEQEVHYVEASWTKGYHNLDAMCKDDAILLIATGKIDRIIKVTNDNNYLYTTQFAFKIDNLLKGNKETKEIIVNQIGSPDGSGFQFSDDPLFNVGENYLLFLRSNDNIHYFLPGPWGRYQIIDGKTYSLNNTVEDKNVYQAPEGLDFNGIDISGISDNVNAITNNISTE